MTSQLQREAASNSPIPVMRPLLPRAERLLPYLRRIDETRLYSNYGPLSVELERRLAQALDLPAGGLVCASSGTAALVGAILASAGRASPAKPLALVPAFTFAATACAAEQCGFEPYFADIDSSTWMLDADRLADHRVLDRVGLVVPVGPFGRPVPQDAWLRFRSATGIPVVIDGAAGLAALAERPHDFLGGVPVAISFHATKVYATGEGGAVATSDLDLAKRSSQALNFGISGIRDCRMASTNGKMSEYHAAVGLAELDDWPAKLAAFGGAAARYRRALAGTLAADRFHAAPEIGPNYAVFECRDAAETEAVESRLRADRIEFRRWYGFGLHRESYYAGCERDDTGVTDDLATRLLGIPVAPDLSQASVDRVVRALT